MQDQLPHLTDDQISTLLDEQLSMDDRAAVDQHLLVCPDCRAAVSDLELTIHTLRTLPEPALPRSFLISAPTKPGIWKRLRSWDLGIRALAAVAAAMFVMLLSVDLAAINRSAGIVPLSTSARPAPQPAAVKSSEPLAAPAAPVTSARSAESGLAPKAAATGPVAAAPRDDSARLEALTARDAVSNAAGPLSSSSQLSALSTATLGLGLLTVILVIVSVVRAVRNA